jgi:hypothetical protein
MKIKRYFLRFIFFLVLLLIISILIIKRVPSEQTFSKENFESLSYLVWVSDRNNISKRGVTKNIKSKAFSGFNLYNSRNLPAALLIDMEGRVLHEWTVKTQKDDTWNHIEICSNGDLLAIVKDKTLIRIDWNSNIRWIKKMRFHHDISIWENRDIYSLIRRDRLVFRSGFPYPILEDVIVVLSPEGKLKKSIPIYNIVKDEIPEEKFKKIYLYLSDPYILKKMRHYKKYRGYFLRMDTAFDIFHTNTVDVIPINIRNVCSKGDLLVSVRELDLIVIIDQKSEKLIWKWGAGELDKPHHPVVLENGNILIFDNGYEKNEYSRIIELDPLKKEIVWEYTGNSREIFFSGRSGGNQRLPNGNTLITESDKGRVFEVTGDKEIVWEFYNPEIKWWGKKRAAIYRMKRIFDPTLYPWLEDLIGPN